MIPTEQAFIEFKTKTEKNLTNDGLSTDRGRFVILFNEAQNKWIEFHLQQKGIDDIRYIEKFLVVDHKLTDNAQKEDHQDFIFPEDYLDQELVRVKASKGKCKRQNLYTYPAKPSNLAELLQDENNKPSWKWREAPYIIGSNKVTVYNGNEFKVDEVLLSYYRYPKKISLQDPDNPESQFVQAIQIEWDKKNLDRIVSLAAGEFDININNPRFQTQLGRAQK